MTAYIKKAIGISERTQEVPDWTRDTRLQAVAEEAWAHTPEGYARNINIQCTLAVVAAKRPPTFEMAARMVRELAYIKSRMTITPVEEPRAKPRPKKDAPKPIDDSAGRAAIEAHAVAEREWEAKRGAEKRSLAELTRLARNALIRVERRRGMH